MVKYSISYYYYCRFFMSHVKIFYYVSYNKKQEDQK